MTTPFPFVANTVLTAAQLNAITTLPISAQTASYTLVVGDVGKRVQMSNASSTTITVNTGIFAAGDTIWIQNIGAGTCTITAGTATVGTASSLALAQYGGGTLVFQSASAATFFSGGGASYGTATGGTSSSITVGGINYTLLSFTTDGTLTVTKSGLFDWYFVGGGGSGGANGRGGGAGGMHTTGTSYFTANQSITVGAGAAKHLITVNVATYRNELFSGISGGTIAMSGAFGVDPYGGTGLMGGGSGGDGTTATAGAAGTTVTFAGGSTVLGGGGGGGGATSGAGGSGGGGAGGAGAGAGVAGTANTGGGGGGGGNAGGNNGGIGGSGIVYVRFKI